MINEKKESMKRGPAIPKRTNGENLKQHKCITMLLSKRKMYEHKHEKKMKTGIHQRWDRGGFHKDNRYGILTLDSNRDLLKKETEK